MNDIYYKIWYNCFGDDMKKSWFKIIFNILFFVFIILVIIYNEQITTYIVNNYIYNKNTTIEITKNEYALNKDYEYVKITNDFIAHDYQHLLNMDKSYPIH